MDLKQSVLATLIYHDIFDYPLKVEEIELYLIEKQANIKNIQREIDKLIYLKKIGTKNNFYCLNKREKIVLLRNKRQRISQKKIKKALFYSKILKLIPTIQLLAVTGALSMKNSKSSDDIDFMIITKKNNLWVTRALANIALIFFKRNPKNKKKSNLACLNIFLDEQSLKIKEKNLYTAHEIAQANILWDRNNLTRKFFTANKWINNYLPNYKQKVGYSHKKNMQFIFPKFIENISKIAQLTYMKPKITNEIIGERQLFFHPQKTQYQILNKYNQKLKDEISKPLTKNKQF